MSSNKKNRETLLRVTRKKSFIYEEQDESKVKEFKHIIRSIDKYVYIDEMSLSLLGVYFYIYMMIFIGSSSIFTLA